jgi:hypothetical protein
MTWTDPTGITHEMVRTANFKTTFGYGLNCEPALLFGMGASNWPTRVVTCVKCRAAEPWPGPGL